MFLTAKFQVCQAVQGGNGRGDRTGEVVAIQQRSAQHAGMLTRFAGMLRDSLLLVRPRWRRSCIWVRDEGMAPVRRLPARLRTLSLDKAPMSEGMGPEKELPIKLRMRSVGKEEGMQVGMEPEMPFQSAMTRVVSESKWQIDVEREPVI
uniref:Uncharacterized protein n=1 Tax=Kalanchoe fedtschenkoi TaxID=63787 RepID=A0A7N0TCV6_KALFE